MYFRIRFGFVILFNTYKGNLNIYKTVRKFAVPNLSLICFCSSKILKTKDYTQFSIQKNILNLYVSVVNSQRLFSILINGGIKAFYT